MCVVHKKKKLENLFIYLGDPPSISSYLMYCSFSCPLLNYDIETVKQRNRKALETRAKMLYLEQPTILDRLV